jgi:hypothetical protein
VVGSKGANSVGGEKYLGKMDRLIKLFEFG